MALDYDFQVLENDQEEDIRYYLKHNDSDYQIILLNQNKEIGYIRIDWMDKRKTKAWLRFSLGEERGKGYGKKAIREYLKILINNGCIRVEAEVYSSNKPSQTVLESLGFKKEGCKNC